MPFSTRVPPGRAGCSWLRRRIDTATRGREQLDRKLRILLPERQRLRLHAEHRRSAWEAASAEAQTWLLRAVLVSGEDALRHASPTGSLGLRIVVTSSMGVTYPVDVQITAPPPSTGAADNAAIERAAAAFVTAVAAGARCAAAQEAVRRVEAETAVARRRLRALDKRWLPWLQTELARRQLSLDQDEQDDGVRLRRALPAIRPRSER